MLVNLLYLMMWFSQCYSLLCGVKMAKVSVKADMMQTERRTATLQNILSTKSCNMLQRGCKHVCLWWNLVVAADESWWLRTYSLPVVIDSDTGIFTSMTELQLTLDEQDQHNIIFPSCVCDGMQCSLLSRQSPFVIMLLWYMPVFSWCLIV